MSRMRDCRCCCHDRPQICAHARMHVHRLTHLHARFTHTHTRTDARTHARTHSLTHSHAHACTHVHGQHAFLHEMCSFTHLHTHIRRNARCMVQEIGVETQCLKVLWKLRGCCAAAQIAGPIWKMLATIMAQRLQKTNAETQQDGYMAH